MAYAARMQTTFEPAAPSGPTRRGVALTPMETRKDVIVEMAALADRLGYEIFSVPEGWGFDSTVLLTEVALRTERIRPMAGILSIWGRSPGTLAMTAASLAEVSDDRFILGLGASTKPLVEGFHGLPFARPARRLATTLRRVRTLLKGERAALPDDISARALRLGQPPRPDLPIYVAAMGKRAVEVTATQADGWFPFYVTRDGMTARIEAARKLRRAAGRGDDLTVLAGPNVAFDADPATARQSAAANLAWYMAAMGGVYAKSARSEGYGAEVDAIIAANPRPSPSAGEVPAQAERLLDQVAVWGGADAIRRGLDRWKAAADVVMLNIRPGAPWDEIEAILHAGAPVRTYAAAGE